MNFKVYINLFKKLTSLNMLSVSKKKIFKNFIQNEYNTSLEKKKKLKIGQLKFHYNPLIIDKYVIFPKFELKSNANTSTVFEPTSPNTTQLPKLVVMVAFLVVLFFSKTMILSLINYFLGGSLPELNQFLLDNLFQMDDVLINFNPQLTQLFQEFLF